MALSNNSGSTILLGERICKVGEITSSEIEDSDVIIDAGGSVAAPGLIDSHVHITFGDFTPRQNTVGYLHSYLHGGVTTSISASEVHVPGRPTDLDGVKALAVAARKCFENFKPGGMRVYAGSLILEPGLTSKDYQDVVSKGVWLAKAGFGAVNKASEYVRLVSEARKAGLFTTLHTGGASISRFISDNWRRSLSKLIRKCPFISMVVQFQWRINISRLLPEIQK